MGIKPARLELVGGDASLPTSAGVGSGDYAYAMSVVATTPPNETARITDAASPTTAFTVDELPAGATGQVLVHCARILDEPGKDEEADGAARGVGRPPASVHLPLSNSSVSEGCRLRWRSHGSSISAIPPLPNMSAASLHKLRLHSRAAVVALIGSSL